MENTLLRRNIPNVCSDGRRYGQTAYIVRIRRIESVRPGNHARTHSTWEASRMPWRNLSNQRWKRETAGRSTVMTAPASIELVCFSPVTAASMEFTLLHLFISLFFTSKVVRVISGLSSRAYLPSYGMSFR
jgi:hypothetical protein